MIQTSVPVGDFNGYQFIQEIRDTLGLDLLGKITFNGSNMRIQGTYDSTEEANINIAISNHVANPNFNSTSLINELLVTPRNGPLPPEMM